ncbi:MAG: general secretion pathway protein GspK [Candidatus Rokubacteria bacterium]|nr:general secretion pathway protein GspK [Candidatus Rokubacteria bacterium]
MGNAKWGIPHSALRIPHTLLLANEHGVALLLVLWITLLLTVIAAGFAVSVRVEGTAALNARGEAEAHALALAGFQRALAELLEAWDYNALTEDGQAALIRLAGGERRGGQSSPAKPPIVQRDGTLARGAYRYQIVDEERRINVNRASREILVRLMDTVGLPPGSERDTIADSILDWIDPDPFHRLNGAEDDYYERLSPSYRAKNGPLDSIEELRLIRGVTPEVYDLLAPHLTVWGSGQINLNTATPTVLQAMVPQIAPLILAQREAQPLVQPQQGGIVRSTVFTVESTGRSSSGMPRTTRGVVKLEGKERLLVKMWNDVVGPGRQ